MRVYPFVEDVSDMTKSTLKIGEFARIGNVSIVTLRHYDQYGLLKPHMLDPETGYRYYSLDQLPRLHRILALKDLSFPLEEIAWLLEEDLSLKQLQALFRHKQVQLRQMIDAEEERLARVAARLRQIEQEGNMPAYDILLKQIDPLLVASVRASIPSIADIGRLQEQLAAYLYQNTMQQPTADMIIWHTRHEMHDEEMSVDVEAAVPLQVSLPTGNGQVNIRTLPAGLMACTVHTGHALSLGLAYIALHRWMEENGYRHTGPLRQIRLRHGEHLESNQYVTELQFPVEKLQRS
jgi:DNA-binding transcriptional MerR regulator